MANLFTSQTPSGTNNSDGTPGISVGTSVTFAVSGTVTGIRFYATTTVSGVYTGALYQVTTADVPGPGAGTLLASKVLGTTPTTGTWNTITFTTPVSVSTGVLYRAVLFSGDGRYVNTASFYGSALTNGNITAPANGSDPVLLGATNQGVFTINASLTYPIGTFNSSNYFADVEFTAGSGTAPTGIALPISLGTPAVSLNLSTAPTGQAVSISLGTPAVSLNLGAAPTGLNVPVAPGNPSAVIAATPGGVALPISLGTPAASDTVLTAGAPGSWWTLLSIERENRQYALENRGAEAPFCPNDGEVLQRNPRTGRLQCRFDGYVYRGW